MTITLAMTGATGTVGGHVLAHILQHTEHRVNCFVRSEKKLQSQLEASSELEDTKWPSRIKVFEGDLSNIDTLQACIKDTAVVYLCAAAAANEPGTKIGQDQAQAVITALRQLRSSASNQDSKLPKLVYLTSSMTEARFNTSLPWLFKKILYAGNYFIYRDLEAAERTLRSQADWVDAVYFKPGGLSHDPRRRGHEISETTQMTFVGYADCAAAMVDVGLGLGDGRWVGKSVSVVTREKAGVNWSVPMHLLRGLVVYFFPGLYPYVG